MHIFKYGSWTNKFQAKHRGWFRRQVSQGVTNNPLLEAVSPGHSFPIFRHNFALSIVSKRTNGALVTDWNRMCVCVLAYVFEGSEVDGRRTQSVRHSLFRHRQWFPLYIVSPSCFTVHARYCCWITITLLRWSPLSWTCCTTDRPEQREASTRDDDNEDSSSQLHSIIVSNSININCLSRNKFTIFSIVWTKILAPYPATLLTGNNQRYVLLDSATRFSSTT